MNALEFSVVESSLATNVQSIRRAAGGQGKSLLSRALGSVGRLLIRWLEILGENPPLSRKQGFEMYRYLRKPQ